MTVSRRIDARTAAIAIGALLVVAAYAAVVALSRSYYAVSGAPGSVFSTSPEGLSVLSAYMEELGVRTQTLQDFDELPRRATVVLAAERPLEKRPSSAEKARVMRWVRDGGRLVLLGRQADELVGLVGDLGGRSTEGGRSLLHMPAYADGVREVHLGSDRILTAGPQWVTHAKDEAGQMVISRAIGLGEVVWVADTHPATNEGISEADNARFVTVLLAGPGRPVHFDEYHHGYVRSGGAWARLGSGGRVAVMLLAASALLALLARARRLGPPIPAPQVRSARGGGFVGSLAELYRRAGARTQALDSLADGLVRSVARRHGSAEIGLARHPSAAGAVERVAELKQRGGVSEDEFIQAAGAIRRARRELEGIDGRSS